MLSRIGPSSHTSPSSFVGTDAAIPSFTTADEAVNWLCHLPDDKSRTKLEQKLKIQNCLFAILMPTASAVPMNEIFLHAKLACLTKEPSSVPIAEKVAENIIKKFPFIRGCRIDDLAKANSGDFSRYTNVGFVVVSTYGLKWSKGFLPDGVEF